MIHLRLVLLATLGVALGCKHDKAEPAAAVSKPVPRDDAAGSDAAPTDAAVALSAPADAGLPFAGSPSPELRALGEALAAVSDDSRTWIMESSKLRPEGVDPPAPPESLRTAVTALLAWDRNPAPIESGCRDDSFSSYLSPLLAIGRAAPMLAPTPEAGLRAALHLGEALQRTQNGVLMRFGLGIAVDAARWASEHHLHSKQFALYAPSDTLPLDVARADACRMIEGISDPHAVDQIPKDPVEYARARRDLGLGPDGSLDAELPALLAFWRETKAQLDRAHTLAELRAVLAAREAAAQHHPSSAFVHVLGRPPPGIESVAEQVAEYGKLAGN